MFLITGSGRSGTKYMATVLRQCGLDVGHERPGRDGIVSSYYCFEAAWYPGQHVAPRPAFDVVLHQVRHPLRSIASITTGHSWKWTCQFLPVGPRAPLLRRACWNWLVFNEEAERQAIFTYRVEDLEEAWGEIERLLGFEADYRSISDVPRDINARRHRAVAWADVRRVAPGIYGRIRTAAKRYGYRE
jgi:hypothetical protein